jgi:hypothetical protein
LQKLGEQQTAGRPHRTAAGARPPAMAAGAAGARLRPAEPDAGTNLLDLPRPLLAAIAARCSAPSGLLASCRALAALGADLDLRARWFVAHRPTALPLPYAAARCRLLAGRPVQCAFELLEAAHAALIPGRTGQRARREAHR